MLMDFGGLTLEKLASRHNFSMLENRLQDGQYTAHTFNSRQGSGDGRVVEYDVIDHVME